MRVLRRVGIAAVVALVVGAAGNVGVAWWLAATAAPEFARWGALGGPWRLPAPEGWPEETSAGYGYDGTGWVSGESFATNRAGGEAFHLIWCDSGWPSRSMRMQRFERVGPDAVPASVSTSRLPPATGVFAVSGGAPPLTPLWPGFLVNTMAYAGIAGALAAPLLLVAPARRWGRARRGQCRGCGYELAGLDPCPECGMAAASRRAR